MCTCNMCIEKKRKQKCLELDKWPVYILLPFIMNPVILIFVHGNFIFIQVTFYVLINIP